jgi:hypothetical protein
MRTMGSGRARPGIGKAGASGGARNYYEGEGDGGLKGRLERYE